MVVDIYICIIDPRAQAYQAQTVTIKAAGLIYSRDTSLLVSLRTPVYSLRTYRPKSLTLIQSVNTKVLFRTEYKVD